MKGDVGTFGGMIGIITPCISLRVYTHKKIQNPHINRVDFISGYYPGQTHNIIQRIFDCKIFHI